MTQLTSKPVWFITGCSTGFGKELATILLKRNYNVVVTARNLDQVEGLTTGYEDNALAIALDVTDKGQINDAIKAVIAKFGRVDVLVNNAGYGYFSSIEEGEEEKIRAQFETNFFGLVHVIQAVLPVMRHQKSGHIVNFSSIGGLRAFSATGYYHATKFAVEGLSESLSHEVAPLGIKILIVEPGPFRTDWAGRSTSRTATQLEDYQQTVGTRMAASLNGSGKQQGDPVRGAEAIITAVESEDHHLRLLLGEPAHQLALEKIEMLRKNFDAWKSLTLGADYPVDER